MSHERRSRLHDFRNSAELSHIEKEILKYLHDHYQSAGNLHQVLDIARGIGKKTKHDVNPSLYNLQKKGFVNKVVESPPTWKLLKYEQSLTVQSSLRPQENVEPPTTPNYPIPETFTSGDFSHGVYSQASSVHPNYFPSESTYQPSTSQYKEPVVASRVDNSRNRHFEIPLSPEEILNNDAFGQISLKGPAHQHTKNENIERFVLDLLNNHHMMRIEDIHEMKRVKVEDINDAIKSLLERQEIKKIGDFFSITPSMNSMETKTFNTFVDRSGGSETVPKAVSGDARLNLSAAKSQIPTLRDGKNAISLINEYAQNKKLLLHYEESISGPDHMRRFRMKLKLGSMIFRGPEAMTKKDARLKTAEVALCQLYQSGEYQTSSGVDDQVHLNPQSEQTIHDEVAALVVTKFNELIQQLPDVITGRKIIAGFVMSKKLISGETDFKVVSIGSGNRCVSGDKLSLRGETVNDCHAEVIARRGLVRFLYREILKLYEDPKSRTNSILEVHGDRFALVRGVEFHLYISTAPCGDSAIFSPSDAATDDPNQEIHIRGGAHHPLFENKKQGLLRTKVENGEGCIPIEEDSAIPTWDGILRGVRLRTMSCSDKIAKWNFLGLQGSLLTHFMEPIYMSTLTLGMLYNHGHLTRAVCCRVEKFINNLGGQVNLRAYTVHHPVVSGLNHVRETGKLKTREFSVNWCIEDDKPEVLDGTEGKCEQRFGSTNPSRICKSELFNDFKKVCQMTNVICHESYLKNKMSAASYQEAKALLYAAFDRSGFGKWMKKPQEEKDF